MTLKDFKFYKLEQNTDIKPFKCSDEDLNGFLVEDAKNYLNEMLASTYILEDIQNAKTVAYFSLLNDSISFNAETMQKSTWNHMFEWIVFLYAFSFTFDGIWHTCFLTLPRETKK